METRFDCQTLLVTILNKFYSSYHNTLLIGAVVLEVALSSHIGPKISKMGL